jgi:hypothetical protein
MSPRKRGEIWFVGFGLSQVGFATLLFHSFISVCKRCLCLRRLASACIVRAKSRFFLRQFRSG